MMDKRSLFIRYGSKWDDNEQYYNGCQLKEIFMLYILKYDEPKGCI